MKNIAVYLMGGFGNQLFQYLHALKLKREGNMVSVLADWYFKPLPAGTTLRELQLHRLSHLEIPIIFASDLLEQGNILSPYGFDQFDQKLIEFRYGYFQSTAEIPDSKTLKEFFLQFPVNDRFKGLTAMHLRLGDYVNLGRNLPEQYYVDIFNSNPDTEFVIFCENEEDARIFLARMGQKNYIFAREVDPLLKGDAVSDFIALSSSATLYGANSTFSYLAGLGVGYRGGSCIAPDTHYWGWFDKDGLDNWSCLLDHHFIIRKT